MSNKWNVCKCGVKVIEWFDDDNGIPTWVDRDGGEHKIGLLA